MSFTKEQGLQRDSLICAETCTEAHACWHSWNFAKLLLLHQDMLAVMTSLLFMLSHSQVITPQRSKVLACQDGQQTVSAASRQLHEHTGDLEVLQHAYH
jgi:hypothetical protein